MTKTIATLILLWMLPVQESFAQQEEPRFTQNCVYLELLGQGILYSVNFDHRFTPSVSVRIGFTSWSFPTFFVLGGGRIDFLGVPLMVNYLSGEGRSHLELGCGIVLCRASMSETWLWGEPVGVGTEAAKVLGTATIGYRYQPRTKGLMVKVAFTPLFSSKRVLPMGGISLGFAF